MPSTIFPIPSWANMDRSNFLSLFLLLLSFSLGRVQCIFLAESLLKPSPHARLFLLSLSAATMDRNNYLSIFLLLFPLSLWAIDLHPLGWKSLKTHSKCRHFLPSLFPANMARYNYLSFSLLLLLSFSLGRVQCIFLAESLLKSSPHARIFLPALPFLSQHGKT